MMLGYLSRAAKFAAGSSRRSKHVRIDCRLRQVLPPFVPWEKRARALMCKWANCVDQEATTDEEYDSDDENVVVSNLAYTADPPLREPDVKRTDWGVCPWGTKRMAGAPFYYVNDPNSVNLELRERTSPRVQFS